MLLNSKVANPGGGEVIGGDQPVEDVVEAAPPSARLWYHIEEVAGHLLPAGEALARPFPRCVLLPPNSFPGSRRLSLGPYSPIPLRLPEGRDLH